MRYLSIVDSMGKENVSSSAVECIWSHLICISTTVIPSLVLLGILRLTLCLIPCLALLPAAAVLWPAVIAAYGYNPVLLVFDMRLGEIAEVDFEEELALLWYLFWSCVC